MRTDDEIEALARSFEAATLPRPEWTHAAHLTVALWHLRRYPRDEATCRLREGIRRLNRGYGNLTGYHETITLAWVAVVAGFLAEHDRGQPTRALAGALVESCGDPGYLLRFYSRPVLASDRARGSWVPPDLRPIERGEDDGRGLRS